jgi:hypothetical protein
MSLRTTNYGGGWSPNVSPMSPDAGDAAGELDGPAGEAGSIITANPDDSDGGVSTGDLSNEGSDVQGNLGESPQDRDVSLNPGAKATRQRELTDMLDVAAMKLIVANNPSYVAFLNEIAARVGKSTASQLTRAEVLQGSFAAMRDHGPRGNLPDRTELITSYLSDIDQHYRRLPNAKDIASLGVPKNTAEAAANAVAQKHAGDPATGATPPAAPGSSTPPAASSGPASTSNDDSGRNWFANTQPQAPSTPPRSGRPTFSSSDVHSVNVGSAQPRFRPTNKETPPPVAAQYVRSASGNNPITAPIAEGSHNNTGVPPDPSDFISGGMVENPDNEPFIDLVELSKHDPEAARFGAALHKTGLEYYFTMDDRKMSLLEMKTRDIKYTNAYEQQLYQRLMGAMQTPDGTVKPYYAVDVQAPTAQAPAAAAAANAPKKHGLLHKLFGS